MGQFDILHANVETVINNPGKRLGVDVAIYTGRTLAGSDGTNLCAGAAEIKPAFCHKGFRFGNLFKGNTDDLRRQAGSENDLSVAVGFRTLRNGMEFIRSEQTANGNDSAGKAFRTPVQQKTSALDTRDLILCNSHFRYRPFHY